MGDIKVTTRVHVDISAREVEHALRCWVGQTLVDRKLVPPPRDFSQIAIVIEVDDDGNLLGCSADYEPETPTPGADQ
ncbi:hypothetical protein EIK56_17890 [Sphingomonas sp. C8-2]|nr:hypothetical protein EIK56_17890 [Sphingomonas sp. C8-2]